MANRRGVVRGQGLLDKYSRKAIEDDYRKSVEADRPDLRKVVRKESENAEARRDPGDH
jgi:hypothetical protein